MDLLDRLLGHDVWATRRLLILCENLTGEQWDREFDIARRVANLVIESALNEEKSESRQR